MMAFRRIAAAAVLALGVLGAAWLASDRILWPFMAAGLVIGVARMGAYRFVWCRLLRRWTGGRGDQTLGGWPSQASEVTKVRRR
jgi:hypothetical protein